MGSLSQFEEYGDPLLRRHLSAGKRIGSIGFLKGVEHADHFLHHLIVRRYPSVDFTFSASFFDVYGF